MTSASQGFNDSIHLKGLDQCLARGSVHVMLRILLRYSSNLGLGQPECRAGHCHLPSSGHHVFIDTAFG